LKNGADFFNGVQQVGVEILTSKIRQENGDTFKNSLKGQSHEKFGEMRARGLSLGHN
jgi:hypothetical protein